MRSDCVIDLLVVRELGRRGGDFVDEDSGETSVERGIGADIVSNIRDRSITIRSMDISDHFYSCTGEFLHVSLV